VDWKRHEEDLSTGSVLVYDGEAMTQRAECKADIRDSRGAGGKQHDTDRCQQTPLHPLPHPLKAPCFLCYFIHFSFVYLELFSLDQKYIIRYFEHDNGVKR
jgi:hypothetical protein